MMNIETVKKLHDRVNNILANLAYNDYKEAYNKSDRCIKGKYTKSGRERVFKGYSLSDNTMEARKMLELIYNDMTREEEETIKGYIMRIRLLTPEYLEVRS